MLGRILKILLAFLTFVGWAPLAIAALATGIASSQGCRLTEAGPSPCVIGGRDYGAVLLDMSMMWWVAMLTVPIGLVTLVAWGFVWMRRVLMRRAR